MKEKLILVSEIKQINPNEKNTSNVFFGEINEQIFEIEKNPISSNKDSDSKLYEKLIKNNLKQLNHIIYWTQDSSHLYIISKRIEIEVSKYCNITIFTGNLETESIKC